jgi:alpha-mannosidase
MRVPEAFDFTRMERSSRLVKLPIVADITLRAGCTRIEIEVTVENNALDHRLRALFPTGLAGDTYWSDAAFDAVERPVALLPDNDRRRELDVETRPQATWTAFGNEIDGLAVVSRGLPESAICGTPDRPIALTLIRGFRKAVFSDDNPGGQVVGTHRFRFDIVPFSEPVPITELFRLGQRVSGPVRAVSLSQKDIREYRPAARLPRRRSFLECNGNAVISSVRLCEGALSVRMFNPLDSDETQIVSSAFPEGSPRCVTLDGREDTVPDIAIEGGAARVTLPPKRIVTVVFEKSGE